MKELKKDVAVLNTLYNEKGVIVTLKGKKVTVESNKLKVTTYVKEYTPRTYFTLCNDCMNAAC